MEMQNNKRTYTKKHGKISEKHGKICQKHGKIFINAGVLQLKGAGVMYIYEPTRIK